MSMAARIARFSITLLVSPGGSSPAVEKGGRNHPGSRDGIAPTDVQPSPARAAVHGSPGPDDNTPNNSARIDTRRATAGATVPDTLGRGRWLPARPSPSGLCRPLAAPTPSGRRPFYGTQGMLHFLAEVGERTREE